MDVLPAEEQEILLQHGLNVGVGEVLADSAAMFVVDDAGGLVKHFPAAFPGHVAEVGVFQIEGREKVVEAAQLEKFAAIEGAVLGTMSAVVLTLLLGAAAVLPRLRMRR